MYAGALAAGIANVFVFNAIRLVGPTRATAMQFLVPAGAVVLGAVFLDEPIGLGAGGRRRGHRARRLADPAAVDPPGAMRTRLSSVP